MLRKLSIIFIRLAPVLLAIKILVLLLAEYFVVSSLLIGLVSSITDLLIAIGLLILSLTFKFCIYHRLIILYENGKLESHWLTNEEINNKTR